MIPYRIVSIKDLKSVLDTTKPLMFDTETDELYGPIVLAQFYQEELPEVLMVKDPNPTELKDFLSDYHLIMQNASYDVSVIQEHSNSKWIPDNFDDTFYLARLKYYKEPSFSLDDVMKYVLGYDPYKEANIDKKELQKTKWKVGKPLTEKQLLYASLDVYYLIDVWNSVKPFCEDINYRLDLKTTKHCLDFQNNGMPVDERKRVAKEMRNNLKIEELAVPVNVNSWKQVRPYIGEEESDDLALAKFAHEGNEKAEQVREARKLTKQNSFLIKKFKTDTGYITGCFSPSTRSGRLACKNQNLQQIPRKLKGVFGYKEDEDKVLIYSDFSQLELRSACAVIGERTMAKLYYNNEDLHTFARDNLGLSPDKKGRQIAKTCNFNLLYGGSAGMLGSILLKDADIFLPEDDLYRLKAKWLDLWHDIHLWHKKGVEDWSRHIAWKTPLGRRYLGDRMTDHLNIKIQGTGADVAKFALHKIMKQISKFDGSVVLNNFIHDSYILTAPNNPDIYQEVAEIVGNSMQSSWFEMSEYFAIQDIPMPVEVKVGYNWGDIEDEEKEDIYTFELA